MIKYHDNITRVIINEQRRGFGVYDVNVECVNYLEDVIRAQVMTTKLIRI